MTNEQVLTKAEEMIEGAYGLIFDSRELRKAVDCNDLLNALANAGNALDSVKDSVNSKSSEGGKTNG